MSSVAAGPSHGGGVPAWNPHKPAAPMPPTSQTGTSSQSQSNNPGVPTNYSGSQSNNSQTQSSKPDEPKTRVNTSVVHTSEPRTGANSSNPRSASSSRLQSTSSAGTASYPDVAADSVDVYEPSESGIEQVAPDYPEDSLPRPRRSSNRENQMSETSAGTNQNVVARGVQNSSGGRANSQTNARQTSEGSQVVVAASRSGLPVVTGNIGSRPTAQRMSGDRLPQTLSQSVPTVVHHSSSVSVNINQPVPPGANSGFRQIRTHDMNAGVMSWHDRRIPDNTAALPDIVPHAQPPRPIPTSARPHPVMSPVADPHVRQSQGHRGTSSEHRHRDVRRRRRRSRRHSRSSRPDPCKEGCLKCLAAGTSFRWILVVLSLLGVCCVVTGIVLAALHAAGKSFLFLAIMFIGLGVLLVVVVGVGWKCTPRGHEPLHALFNLGEFRSHHGRHRRSRHRREGRWAGGVMYPEFQYRRPPPSYNASMQEYQHQILSAQQNPATANPDLYNPNNLPDEDYSLPSSPPPSYRSRASTVRAGIQITFPPNQGGEFPDSRPPTYRSHPSNTLQGHGRTRPSLSRDDDNDNDVDDRAPEDVAFTGSAVIVDTSTSQSSTSIQIAPVDSQNVTVSVTTVSVTAQPVVSEGVPNAGLLPLPASSGQGTPSGEREATPPDFVDSVGDMDGDRVDTAL